MQGPNALEVLRRATGGPLPEIPFFNMGELTIAGHTVRALHHGMSGAPGMELFGPWEERDEVKSAIVEAGSELGLLQVGSRVYATNTLESGWIPCPLPAVFTGDELKSYREWLPAERIRGHRLPRRQPGTTTTSRSTTRLPGISGTAGSSTSTMTSSGADALEAMGEPTRRKVTLSWNGDDVARAMATLFEQGDPAKYIDLPLSNYSTWPNDRVCVGDETVGVSTFSGYTFNERSFLSLAIVDDDVELGNEVVLVWGEEDGGSAKPVVERHRQVEIRAIVSPCPYSEVARTQYAEGWRTRAAAV